jgi:hypothetical protein
MHIIKEEPHDDDEPRSPGSLGDRYDRDDEYQRFINTNHVHLTEGYEEEFFLKSNIINYRETSAFPEGEIAE